MLINRKAVLKQLIDLEMTQTELAKRMGVSIPTVNGALIGRNSPSLETIVAMCRVLGLTPNDVILWEVK